MRWWRLALAALALAGLARSLRAQTPSERLLAQGVQAARDLDYDSAATLLRLSLAHSTARLLTEADRSRAQAYLGATEVYRGQRDSATAVFRRLLLFNPRYRMDQLIFPPEVTAVFDDVRRTYKLVLVVLPPRTEITDPNDRLVAHLFASSSHVVTVAVAGSSGATMRTLYAGELGDSADVTWDGRDSSGAMATSGRYFLRVTSRGADGQAVRTVSVPLDLRAAPRDTLLAPPPLAESLLRPEHTGGGSGARALFGGLLAAAAVVALPEFVSARSDAGNGRFLVAGATGAAGLVGLTIQRRPQPIIANIAANQALRLAWQQQVDQVRAENAVRRREPRLVITAGALQTLGSP